MVQECQAGLPLGEVRLGLDDGVLEALERGGAMSLESLLGVCSPGLPYQVNQLLPFMWRILGGVCVFTGFGEW